MTTLTRRYRFCAGHRLHSEHLSDSENKRTYGKCNNPYGHGHDYVLDISVTGQVNEITGLMVPLSSLDKLVANEVLSYFSHRNLNIDVAEFARLVPTTENVTLVIAERLSQSWDTYFPHASARLSSISMLETDRNSFEVLLPRTVAEVPVSVIQVNESVIVNA